MYLANLDQEYDEGHAGCHPIDPTVRILKSIIRAY